MNDLISNQTITIDCPNCNQTLDISIDKIGSSIICDNCNNHIDLVDDGFSKSIDETNKLLDEIEANLNNLTN